MNDGIVFDLPKNKSAAIKVIGVGGGGSNAVNYMYEEGIAGVDFVICNTDAQALNNSPIPTKIQLGTNVTEGLGAGANPEVGKQSALENAEDIKGILDSNTKMVFITAGMGGGTGTGAAPIIAGMAKDAGILTVGIVTVPFYFEGARRMQQAEAGVEELRKNVDSLIVINNDKLRELYGNLGFKSGFAKADEILAIAAKGIAEVITTHYKQNIDLRDAKTVLADSGTAIMGSAVASGSERAHKAITDALDSPLLNNNKITGAQNVLLLIVSGNEEVTIDEIGIINEYIQNEAGYNANIIMGVGEDETLGESISVTVVATGFPSGNQQMHLGNQQEQKKTVHTLFEDQPISKVLSPENRPIASQISEQREQTAGFTGFSENIIEKKVKEQIERKNLFQNPDAKKNAEQPENKVVYTLEEEERQIQKPMMQVEVLEEEEPVLKTQTIVQEQPSFSFDFDVHTSFESTPEEEEFIEEPQMIQEKSSELEAYGFEVTKVEMTVPQPKPQVEEASPFDAPIAQTDAETQRMIEERRNKLKMFNYQFKKSIREVEDSERIPAYQRQGIDLNTANQQSTASRMTLNEDSNNDLQLRMNNSFLHDNVD